MPTYMFPYKYANRIFIYCKSVHVRECKRNSTTQVLTNTYKIRMLFKMTQTLY